MRLNQLALTISDEKDKSKMNHPGPTLSPIPHLKSESILSEEEVDRKYLIVSILFLLCCKSPVCFDRRLDSALDGITHWREPALTV